MGITTNLVFNLPTISLFISGLINLILVVIVSLRPNKTQDAKFFVAFSSSVFCWVAARLVFEISEGPLLLISAKALYLSAIFIPLSLVFFIDAFPRKKLVFSFPRIVMTILPAILLAVLTVTQGYIIESVESGPGMATKIINFGPLYFLYFLYVFIMFCFGLIRMGIKLWRSSGIEKRQLEIVFVSILVSASVGVLANLILPTIRIFDYFWVGPLFSVFMVITIAYAISKYQLFDTKVVTTEVLTFLIWIVILIRVLTSTTNDRIINIGMLFITIIIGIYLIRSVIKEIAQREHIEILARDLSVANDQLKDLDSQKNEFVSMASHQLRGPLTAVKGYASMILEGDFGELLPTVKDAVEKIYKSTQDLVVVVGDYLDVSRIEQGRMQYDFSNFDLKELVQSVVNELRPNIENAHLTIQFDSTPGILYAVNADKGKIKQVISNIIDNSIKYTPKGGLHLWLAPKAAADGSRKALISISDTGVGIHPDVMPKLFAKFTRAPDASKTNILGTGLGLYVAKKMIEAHHGRIWAESPGSGKGSTFFIELDLADEDEGKNADIVANANASAGASPDANPIVSVTPPAPELIPEAPAAEAIANMPAQG